MSLCRSLGAASHGTTPRLCDAGPRLGTHSQRRGNQHRAAPSCSIGFVLGCICVGQTARGVVGMTTVASIRTQWGDATARRGSMTQHSVCPHPQAQETRRMTVRRMRSAQQASRGRGDNEGFDSARRQMERSLKKGKKTTHTPEKKRQRHVRPARVGCWQTAYITTSCCVCLDCVLCDETKTSQLTNGPSKGTRTALHLRTTN